LWDQTFGSQAKSAYGCLQLTWGASNQQQATGQFVEITVDGELYAIKSEKDLTRQPISLSLPAGAKQTPHAFHVFVLHRSMTRDKQFALCQSISKNPTYTQRCLQQDEAEFCWFYLSFSPTPQGFQEPISTTNGTCSLHARPPTSSETPTENTKEPQREVQSEQTQPEENPQPEPLSEVIRPEPSTENIQSEERDGGPHEPQQQCRSGETRTCYPGPKGTENTGSCKAGLQHCNKGRWDAECESPVTPTAEICNGKDDDCDGEIDEDGSHPLFIHLSSGSIYAQSITEDSKGNIYILGHFEGRITIQGKTLTSQTNAQNLFLLIFDNKWTLLYALQTHGIGEQQAKHIVFNKHDGYLYIGADVISGNMFVEHPSTSHIISAGAFVGMVNPSLPQSKSVADAIAFVWTSNSSPKSGVSGSPTHLLRGMAPLSTGVAIAMRVEGHIQWDSHSYAAISSRFFTVVAHIVRENSTSNAGKAKWMHVLDDKAANPSSFSEPHALATDDQGNIFVVGDYAGLTLQYQSNTILQDKIDAPGTKHGFMTVIGPIGAVESLIRLNSTGSLSAQAIYKAPTGNTIYIGGQIGQTTKETLFGTNWKAPTTADTNAFFMKLWRQPTPSPSYNFQHYKVADTRQSNVVSLYHDDTNSKLYMYGKFYNQFTLDSSSMGGASNPFSAYLLKRSTGVQKKNEWLSGIVGNCTIPSALLINSRKTYMVGTCRNSNAGQRNMTFYSPSQTPLQKSFSSGSIAFIHAVDTTTGNTDVCPGTP
tara:strand:+ start:10429 stop:12717 length:2289 start_codon:yes stop_codon:yes gene_type:complete